MAVRLTFHSLKSEVLTLLLGFKYADRGIHCDDMFPKHSTSLPGFYFYLMTLSYILISIIDTILAHIDSVQVFFVTDGFSTVL